MLPGLVIFDCDGVLVDSEPLAARVLAEALHDIGWELSLEETDRNFRGRSLADILKELRRQVTPFPEEFLPNLEKKTREAFESGLLPVPGVEQLLKELADVGVDLCVASSGTPEKIRHSLQFTGIDHFFEDRLFSASQVTRGKPAPDLFQFAARQMGHSIEESWVIEDSLPGVQGATASGARVIGYVDPKLHNPAQHREALERLGAVVISRMADATTILGLDSALLD